MTWKIEIAALVVTAASVGGYIYKADLFAEEAVTYHDEFTEADFSAFDRNFPMNGETCEVGLAQSKICLLSLEAANSVRVGAQLPKDVPALSAGMRILLALDSKQPELKTVRLGQTLVLIEPETEFVRDILRLDAPSYEAARDLRGATIGVAAN